MRLIAVGDSHFFFFPFLLNYNKVFKTTNAFQISNDELFVENDICWAKRNSADENLMKNKSVFVEFNQFVMIKTQSATSAVTFEFDRIFSH